MAVTIEITDDMIAQAVLYSKYGGAVGAVMIAIRMGLLRFLVGVVYNVFGFLGFAATTSVGWWRYHSQIGAKELAVCKTGFVTYGDRTFYRDPSDLVLYSVKPGRARFVEGQFVLSDYVLVPEETGTIAESALYGSDPIATRSVAPNDYVSVYVVHDDGYHYLGGGFREAAFLITAAHAITDSLDHRIALSKDGKKFYHPGKVIRHFVNDDYVRCTGDDVGAFELSAADWAVLGVRSVKPSVYSATGMSRIEVFGRDPVGVLKAGVGNLLPPTQKQKYLGVVPHSASTMKGFSGSPVYTIGETGRKIVGLHIAGGTGTENYMASVHEIHQLRRKLGLIPEVPMVAEASPDMKHRQFDRHEHNDLMDDLSRVSKHGGLLRVYDDLAGNDYAESADIPKAVGTPVTGLEPEVSSGSGADLVPALAPVPSTGNASAKEKAASEVADVSTDADLSHPDEVPDELDFSKLSEEEPVPPIGVKRVRNKKVGGIGAFLGTTALAGAVIGKVGSAFDPKWLDCTAASLAEASAASYHAMLNSPNFDRYREYMSASGVVAADQQRTMKGVDGTDLARLFGTGVSNRSRKKALKRLPARFLEVVEKLGLPVKQYAQWTLPPAGVEAMEHSLATQLGRTCSSCWPEETRRQFANKSGPQYDIFLEEVARYPANRADAFANVHSKVTRFVLGLDGDKSAGWSQHFRPGTKRSWQDTEGLTLASYLTRCRLLLRAAVGPCVMAQMTPSQLIEAGLSDPRTLFIKNEPHSDSKVADGRWRLIWGASLVDVCVASVTCRRQDKLDIEQYQGGPVEGGHQQAAGLGHHDAGISRLCVEFQRLIDTGLQVFDSDASGWDMSVNRDSLYADALRRILLYEGRGKAVFERLALCEAAANSAHVVLIGGNLWEVLKPGITASGILSTTAQNSFIRALLYAFVGVRHSVVAGDDGAGAREHGYDHVKALAEYGPEEKQVNLYTADSGLEFTSHRMRRGTDGTWSAEFLNLGKACARLAFGDTVTADQLAGLMFCVRNNPAELKTLGDIAEEMGWPIAGVTPAFLPFLD
ncbi:hypothetical protein 1 [Beihai sobemo-like virus 9]|uniref:hypothetical protein 1 n=1 Tax=Beihai sobemo-like virus 9 TaxID=1922706 RepID=UPI00090C17A0|nr:hypothetical protein 1 [Beihai sobemo-like virus 9]APG75706.1 hypothetical protein 1 [Beihai sobemo-like virus 9]